MLTFAASSLRPLQDENKRIDRQKNVLKAFEVAKSVGAKSVVISRGSGGKSKDLADHCIIVPGTSSFPGQTGKNDNNFHFEDALSSVAHMITGILCAGIKERFAQG